MAYMKDSAGRRLDELAPSRDVLPEVLNHFDASTLTGASDSAVSYWPDSGPFGWDVWQDTAGSRPVLKTAALNGKNYVSCVGNKFLARPAANQHYWLAQSGAYGIPLTFFAVVRAKSGTYSADRAVIGSATQGTFGLIGSTTISGGAQLMLQNRCYGDDIADDTWHVIAAVGDAGGTAVWIDGVLSSALSGSAGTYTLQGAIGLGALANGTQFFDGDIAEVIVANGRMSHRRIADISSALAAKWGLTSQVVKQVGPPSFRDVTSSTSDNVRAYPPRGAVFGTPSSTMPVILWSHPASQNEQISAGYFLYPLVHAAYNNGWLWVGYRGHTDSWGNQSGLDDLAAAVTYIRANYSAGPIILGGGSMGGLSTALAVAGGVTGLKGAFTVDGALSLSNMYANVTYTTAIDTAYGITRSTLTGATSVGATSIPTTGSFPTIGTQLLLGNGTANVETVTTTGASTGTAVAVTATVNTHASADQVSDYSTKTAGHNPILISSGSYGTTVPWRFYASTADTAVNKAGNTDAFVSLLGAVPEKQVVTHVAGHLSNDGVRPRDWVAYIKRCLAL